MVIKPHFTKLNLLNISVYHLFLHFNLIHNPILLLFLLISVKFTSNIYRIGIELENFVLRNTRVFAEGTALCSASWSVYRAGK